MLRKKSNGAARATRLTQALAPVDGGALDRRKFLARSGLLTGGVALASALPVGAVKKADAAVAGPLTAGATRVKSVCNYCAVGCTVIAEVKNGVWVGQEPGWDSPINHGLTLRQGRRGARVCAQRTPPEISDEVGRRPMEEGVLGAGDQRDRRPDAQGPEEVRSGFWSTGSVPRSITTSKPICSASSTRSGAPTTATTRRASATPPRSRASRIRGVTAR